MDPLTILLWLLVAAVVLYLAWIVLGVLVAVVALPFVAARQRKARQQFLRNRSDRPRY